MLILGALPIFGLGIVVLCVASGILFWIRRSGRPLKSLESLPYQKAGPLFTPAERSFYGALRQALDGRFTILAKVRLGDLLEVPYGTPRAMGHKNRINQKHVDFVLCAPEDFTPLLVIELDDSSHTRLDRQERDVFVDIALEAVGLPVLRVAARQAYSPAGLRSIIDDRLTADQGLHAVNVMRL